MSHPYYGNTGGPKKNRGTGSQIKMTADDSLEVEAYGARGAAMRRTAAGIGKAQSDSTGPQRMKASLSNAVSGAVNAIKSLVKTDRK